jgi:hypothetical protein
MGCSVSTEKKNAPRDPRVRRAIQASARVENALRQRRTRDAAYLAMTQQQLPPPVAATAPPPTPPTIAIMAASDVIEDAPAPASLTRATSTPYLLPECHSAPGEFSQGEFQGAKERRSAPGGGDSKSSEFPDVNFAHSFGDSPLTSARDRGAAQGPPNSGTSARRGFRGPVVKRRNSGTPGHMMIRTPSGRSLGDIRAASLGLSSVTSKIGDDGL